MIAPFVAAFCLLAAVGLATLIPAFAPVLAKTILAGEKGRDHALDGLRGLLATSVLVHHCLLPWAHPWRHSPSDNLIIFLGSGAVGYFFMISGYLFVRKILSSGGAIDVGRFLSGRVRRIMPLYIFAVLFAASMTIVLRGFVVEEPFAFLKDFLVWLLFDFVKRSDLNGVVGSQYYLGVVWSLKYEWILYALVPLLAYAYRMTGFRASIFAGLALLAAASSVCSFFLAGAVAAYLRNRWPMLAGSFILWVGLAGIVVAVIVEHGFVGPRAAILLLPMFIAVLESRSRALAWLTSRPLMYLGQISFGIYLLHGVMNSVAIGRIIGDAAYEGLSAPAVALYTLGLFVVTVAVASVTHIIVERPFFHRSTGSPTGAVAVLRERTR